MIDIAVDADASRSQWKTAHELTSSYDAIKDGLVDMFGGRGAVPSFVLKLELAFEQSELGAELHRQQSGRTVPADAQLIGDESG